MREYEGPMICAVIAIACATLCVTSRTADAQAEWRIVPDGRYAGMDSLLSTELLSVAAGLGGRVYVVVLSDPTIHVFGPNLTYERRIGRGGSGPGEFRSAPQIGFKADTLWALDAVLRRATFFTPEGFLIGVTSFATASSAAEGRGMEAAKPVGILFDGQLLMRQAPPMTPTATTSNAEAGLKLLRMPFDGQDIDTVAVLSIKKAVISAQLPQGIRLTLRRPWSFSDLLAVSSNGKHIAVVSQPPAHEDGRGQYTVSRFDTRGELVFTRTFRYDAERLQTDEVDAYLDSKVEDIVSAASLPRARVRETLEDAFAFPKYRPGVVGRGRDPIRGGVLVGADGQIWIGRDTGTVTSWNILGASGDVAATIPISSDIQLVEVAGSVVWGVLVDSDGLPQLSRFVVTQH